MAEAPSDCTYIPPSASRPECSETTLTGCPGDDGYDIAFPEAEVVVGEVMSAPRPDLPDASLFINGPRPLGPPFDENDRRNYPFDPEHNPTGYRNLYDEETQYPSCGMRVQAATWEEVISRRQNVIQSSGTRTPLRVTACIFLNDERERYCISKRKATAAVGAGKWHIAGGCVEDSESLQDCIRREMREEYKIDVSELEEYDTQAFRYPGQDRAVVVTYFWAHSWSSHSGQHPQEPTLAEGQDAWMWCPLVPSFDGLDSPKREDILPTDIRVMEKIATEAQAEQQSLQVHLVGMFDELPLTPAHPPETIDLTVDDLNASE
jgi:8-oxo-dGTP pyrophosphatase MutT (NUDIX family)